MFFDNSREGKKKKCRVNCTEVPCKGTWQRHVVVCPFGTGKTKRERVRSMCLSM